ncbi:hypothetical protein L7F22_066427 [Adiantum nelumboides]|nr:hypothetical protein [Adiantum nelumboides]
MLGIRSFECLRFCAACSPYEAGGLGHGIAHAVFFCLSLLTPSFGKATFYADSCSQMPLFLVAALLSLSFLIIHTSSMIVAFDAYNDRKKSSMFLPPAIHFAASFLSLINLFQGGCLVGVPLVLLCATGAMCYCGKIVWIKVGEQGRLNSSARTNILS